MKRQPEINEKMRAILIDWLIQVHIRFGLLAETLYLTVSIIDRYLSVCYVLCELRFHLPFPGPCSKEMRSTACWSYSNAHSQQI